MGVKATTVEGRSLWVEADQERGMVELKLGRSVVSFVGQKNLTDLTVLLSYGESAKGENGGKIAIDRSSRLYHVVFYDGERAVEECRMGAGEFKRFVARLAPDLVLARECGGISVACPVADPAS